MKKILLLFTILAVLLLAAQLVFAAKGPPDNPGPPDDPGPPQEPDPGQKKDPYAATPNLSFPVIATDILQMFYLQTWVDSDGDGEIDDSEWVLDYDLDDDGVNEMTEPTPIEVTEVINVQYNGSFPGNEEAEHCTYTVGDDGCAVDTNEDGIIDDSDLTCEPMLTWLQSMQPWYDQPVTTTTTDPNLIWNADYVDAANSWQADWEVVDADCHSNNPWFECPVKITFIDWGNPMENTVYPIVGQRFPVEVALYKQIYGFEEQPGGGYSFTGERMTAYGMACLEYPGTKIELFGTRKPLNPDDPDYIGWTYKSAFATILTNQFTAEVWDPEGGITPITLSPGIGPSGKMNFASGSGGWIPTMAGWHRIWLHINDSEITLSDAIVNNDEHYIMDTGCMAQTLNQNKLELTGIIGNSTYIDVLVKTK